MAIDVELPALGESVTEGTITGWLVEVGDTVSEDQPLFELSSDKIDTEVPSPASGTVLEILVQVDETVEIGTVVARIGQEDEAGGSAGGGGASDDAGGQAEESAEQGDSDTDADAAAEETDAAAEETAPERDAAKDSGGGSDDGGDDGGSGGGESVDVTLPELGESVTEGTVTAWLVEVGDEVTEDQPLFELSSDKIDTEVPSPASGTVTEILVQVDETVEVGTVVARLGSGGSGGGAPAGDQDAGKEPSARETQDRSQESAAATPSSGSGSDAGQPAGPDTLASPLVRSLARDNDVDLSQVKGTGQGGRVTREDVQSAIDSGSATTSSGSGSGTESRQATAGSGSAPSQPAATSSGAPQPARQAGERERVEDLSRIRQRIADKMLESQREAAQLTTVQEVDVTALMLVRGKAKDAFKAREGVSLSPFAMIARAAIIAVRDHPTVNAYADWENAKVYMRDYVNLGIAVDTPKGLLVPNVKGADSLTVAGLARGITEAAQKARGENGRKLDFSDIEGGTFTLTNTGSRGVLIDTPILNYPEVAILGVGAIVKRPAVVTGADGSEAIGIRQMMYLSLTYDHRLLDGADAARFVTDVKHVLEGTDWAQEVG